MTSPWPNATQHTLLGAGLGVYWLLHVLDVATTLAALAASPQHHEGQPLVAGLLAIGGWPLYVLSKVASVLLPTGIVLLLATVAPRRALALLGLGCLIMLWIIGQNLQLV